MTSRSLIEEIKERLDIVEVVGSYVSLQKAGRNFRALCPFHTERTPSFYVFPDSGTWHCFGACGVGGDVIHFIEKQENLDFRDALRLLARRAGVSLEEERDPAATSRLNHLREANTLAASFFHHQLLHTAGGANARDYLAQRQITPETGARFQLGYAPDTWDALLRYLSERGFSADDLDAAGLVVRREDGHTYDRFRARLMIPIRDSQGRVIGFGGRILGEGEPKYLNTSQTPLFDKSEVIFALDEAKRALRRLDQAVLVEGYMDVISAHQRGFENVVAAMGTAITPAQLKRLSRYTRNLVLALDADAAGLNATLRSLHTVREALAQAAVPVPTASGRIRFENRLDAIIRVALLPPGQDPDDVLRRDPAQWQQLIAQATPLVEYYFAQAAAAADLSTAHGKSHLVQELLPLLHEIDDAIARRHYVGKLATQVGVTEREIDQALERYARELSRAPRRPRAPAPAPDAAYASAAGEEPPLWPEENLAAAPQPAPRGPAPAGNGLLEMHILAHLVAHPPLLPWVDSELAKMRFDPIDSEEFEEASNRAIFDAQQEFLYSDAVPSPDDFLSELDDLLQPRAQHLRALIQSLQDLRVEQRHKDIMDCMLRLRRSRLQQQCQRLESLIHSADADTLPTLGQQLARMTQDLQQLQRALFNRSQSSRWMKLS